MQINKKIWSFPFSTWDELLNWLENNSFYKAKVQYPLSDCPNAFYTLTYNNDTTFSIVSVSHINNELDFHKNLSREEISVFKSNRFSPTEPYLPFLGYIEEETNEIDMIKTLLNVQKHFPFLVKIGYREVREGKEPDELYLQKLGSLTFTPENGFPGWRGVNGLCIGNEYNFYDTNSNLIHRELLSIIKKLEH